MTTTKPEAILRNPEKVICYILIILAMTVGLYVRLKGLGRWPLATDEYYFAKSVNNILLTGFPRFECGGYYTRGILQQYLVAPLLLLFPSHHEFCLRIVPVLCNVLVIPPLYLLGKKISGNFVACAVVILFSFSLWEIEFARFARMYAPFQAIFIWYVFFLYKAIFEEHRQSERIMLVLSFLSIFIHAGSIFILLLNFFPLLYRKGRVCIDFLFLSKVLILVIGYIYLSINFRRLGVADFLPIDIVDSFHGGDGKILFPTLLVQNLDKNFLFLFVTQVILFLFAVISIFKFNTAIKNKIILTAGIFFALFNMFGMAIICLCSYMFINGLEVEVLSDKRNLWIYFVALISFFIFWLFFGFFSESWFRYLGSTDTFPIRDFLLLLLKYPNYLDSFVYPWLRTIPILTICLAIGIVPVLISSLFTPQKNAGFRMLFMLLFSIVVVMSFISTMYTTTRYTFFVYPLMGLLFVYSVFHIAQIFVKRSSLQIALSVVILFCFMSITEDFSLAHMKGIDSIEYNFRTIYSRKKAAHYYLRSDSRAVAEFVNITRQKGDLVISTLHSPEYYLNQLDYFYLNYRSLRFPGIVSCSGTRNIWTNSLMLYKEEQLLDIIQNRSGKVIIITKSTDADRIYEKFSSNAVFTDASGEISVYIIKSP